MTRARWLSVILFGILATPAVAQDLAPSSGSFEPAVPVSAFARPSSWVDPSRLKVSAEFMMGGGGAGGGYSGLQVTRFQYQIAAPLAVRVSLGNVFGARAPRGNSMFLEGLDLTYRPSPSMVVQFHYQDVRSPLQYSQGDPYGFSPWR